LQEYVNLVGRSRTCPPRKRRHLLLV
jgi:hypothetical protein